MKKAIISVSLILLLLPNISLAAIARNSSAVGGNSGTVTSYTYSYTVGDGSDRALFIGLGVIYSLDVLSSVTYNGVAMTRLSSRTNVDNRFSYLYGMVNPDSGAHNVVVTVSTAKTMAYHLTVDYTGVSQTGLPDAHYERSQTSGATFTISNTTVADNAVQLLYGYAGGTLTANSNAYYVVGTGSDSVALFESNPLAITPAGANNTVLNVSAGGCTGNIISFAPAVAPPVADGQTGVSNITIFE